MEHLQALSLRRPSILLRVQMHFLLRALGAGGAVAAGGAAVESIDVCKLIRLWAQKDRKKNLRASLK